MLLTAIVSSVASAVVLAALGAAWRWGSSLPGSVRRRRESDHQTLSAGPWPVHLPPDCDTADARLVVVCAPSRILAPPAFSPVGAVTFAQERLRFSGDPVYSGVNDGVRLEPPNHTNAVTDYAWVCANGKIQMSLTLPILEDPVTGRRRLDVLTLLDPLAKVAHAVSSPEYRQLYGLPARALRLKTDWLVGVSMYSRPKASNSLPSWNDLVFPEVSPPRLVADRQPFCPPAGYAAVELKDWEINRPQKELLRTFLESFLAENGYHEFDSAVDSALANYATSAGS